MVLLSSTLETLPDEILMIIIRYSGNITSVFRTFSGLNQRLNRILVDRRLHLLTDLLRVNIRQINFNYYYNTPLFHALSEQLCSLRGNDYIHQLDQCFQRLISFHIQEKSRQIEEQYRSDREQFRSIRVNLTDEEIHSRDAELKEAFNNLESHSLNFEYLQPIGDLVVGTGARLECTNHELGEYNLAKALNQHVLAHLYTIGYPSGSCLRSIQRLFKALIISNPNLVNNKDYVGNGGSPMYYFLIYAVFRLQHFPRFPPLSMGIIMQKYDTILELLLFTIQCLKQVFDKELWIKDCILDSLNIVNSIRHDADEKIFIQYSQMEVLKIFMQEVTGKEILLDDYSNSVFQEGLTNLIDTNRLDIIEYVFRQNNFIHNFFTRSAHCYKLINTITGTLSRRQMFQRFLDEEVPEPWLTSAALLFILLKKKECKWIKKLLQLDSKLIHEVDEDGNDPLLYICLKVKGCRHRLIECLIDIGCDIYKKNVHGEHFLQAIQLKRNRKLLKQLIEHEIIVRENESEQLRLASQN
ncbi:unnamed protein product [Adineta steineri]|uniref:Uncharacterized protein n=1 Tax=Adineta steineri TaxID=433720 RepID=A0A813VQR2_9BILA|nr:unnamed protein product [Adineta steineri]